MSGTNERVRELIKRVYALGYDVGYHHHSEIGWVSDTYNALAGQADDVELKNLLRQYYRKGIEEGEKHRRHGVQGRAAKKVGTDRAFELSDYETTSPLSAANTLLQQPRVLSMPGNIMRTVLINQPVNLVGFRVI